jgi:hypothetical protein
VWPLNQAASGVALQIIKLNAPFYNVERLKKL